MRVTSPKEATPGVRRGKSRAAKNVPKKKSPPSSKSKDPKAKSPVATGHSSRSDGSFKPRSEVDDEAESLTEVDEEDERTAAGSKRKRGVKSQTKGKATKKTKTAAAVSLSALPLSATGPEDSGKTLGNYEVRRILAEAPAESDGTPMFKVEWVGFKTATWQTESDCGGCEDLIAEFRANAAEKEKKAADAKKKKPVTPKKKAAAPKKKPAAPKKTTPKKAPAEKPAVKETPKKGKATPKKTTSKKGKATPKSPTKSTPVRKTRAGTKKPAGPAKPASPAKSQGSRIPDPHWYVKMKGMTESERSRYMDEIEKGSAPSDGPGMAPWSPERSKLTAKSPSKGRKAVAASSSSSGGGLFVKESFTRKETAKPIKGQKFVDSSSGSSGSSGLFGKDSVSSKNIDKPAAPKSPPKKVRTPVRSPAKSPAKSSARSPSRVPWNLTGATALGGVTKSPAKGKAADKAKGLATIHVTGRGNSASPGTRDPLDLGSAGMCREYVPEHTGNTPTSEEQSNFWNFKLPSSPRKKDKK